MLATLAGKLQVLMFDAQGLGSYDVKDGKQLWWYDWPIFNDVNSAQPLVLEGDRVFITTGYEKGCVMLHVSEKDGKFAAEEVWKPNTKMRCKFSSPVLFQNFIYGLDDGILACLDPKTGQRKWKGGRYGHGQMLLSGDLLVIFTETGKLVLVRATPERFAELAKMDVFDAAKNWNPLALVAGVAYLPQPRTDGLLRASAGREEVTGACHFV